MFVDARELPDGHLFEADVAVVGAGPAGITLARALASKRLDVVLLESGGREPDGSTQQLYAGEVAGIPYSLEGSRLRFFGGTSNHWGGYCRPLDAIDFEPRDWIPHSGWPFRRDELMPYYDLASEIVEVAPPRFEDPAYWREKTEEPMLGLATGRLRERFFQFSPPTRFALRYGPALERAENVLVALHANVTHIAVTPGAQAVNELAIRTLTGRAHRARARIYVLAAGGLENPRLLLISQDVVAAGLGNEGDRVGRFFMEHPHLGGFAEIVVADPARLPLIYRERIAVDGRTAKVAFVPRPEFLRSRRLLNASFTIGLAGQYQGDEAKAPAPAHLDMLRAARRFLTVRGTAVPSEAGGVGAWFGIGCAVEQAPDPASRVTLGGGTDALGLPRIRLDWRLSEGDRRSMVEHVRSFAYEFGTLGLGRVRLRIEDDGRWPAVVGGGNHHMGTTRMSDNRRTGVVDRHCRVHGLANLYLAGSSVFPTSGSANPTLTIVALALRLADHLEARLA